MKSNIHFTRVVLALLLLILSCIGVVSAAPGINVDLSGISEAVIGDKVTIPVFMYEANNITSFEISIPNNVSGVSIILNSTKPLNELSDGSTYVNQYYPNYKDDPTSSFAYWYDSQGLGVSGDKLHLFSIDVTPDDTAIPPIPVMIIVKVLGDFEETNNLESRYPVTQGSLYVTSAPAVLTSINITSPIEGSSINYGSSDTAIIEAHDQYGNVLSSPAAVSWGSSNVSVLTIDSSTGIYHTVGTGAVRITASSAEFPEITAQVNLTVNKSPSVPTTINLSSIMDVVECHTTGILGIPVVYDQYGEEISASPVTWRSSNSSVLSFEGNVYTANAEGSAIITVTAQNGVNGTLIIVVTRETPVVPKFTIETSSPHEILLGENITISGIAEGTDYVLCYVLAPYYSGIRTIQVASDGSYAANFSTSRLRVDSPCFVVIQHPMYDAIFNVAPVHNELTNNYTCAYQNNTARPSGGTGDIFLFNMTNTTGMYAFEKICQGIDDPANDDLEVNVTFTVRKGDPTAGSLVYIYQNAALKSNTTYYQWVDGNPAGSVTTNFNGTLIGEGIAEGLYSSSSTSPADLFTLKYPMINLSAYLNNTSIPISGRNIPKNQTIDFNVSGNNGLYYALRFLSPDGNSTFTFGNTTFDSYNITKNPEMLNKVSLTNVTPGIWKVYAIFYDSPDSYNTLNTYTPSVYKCSEVIRFDVGTAEPWIFTAVPESPEVSKGNEIVITGTAENTGGTLRYYVFSDHYTIIKRIPVNNDGSYKVNFSTVNLSSGSCFVIIQHPMYDGIFNIGPVHNILTDNFLYIYQNNTAQPTGEDGDIFLVNISNTTGFPAFEIVRQGIDNPANDDRELNVTFRITSVSNDTTLPLKQGWNFIAVPKTLNATKNTAGSLFGSVDTGGKNILGYNSQTEMWTPVTAAEIISPLNGYWIYAAAGTDITLSYPSEPASTADKILYPGWNAVGLSADEQKTAETALACLNGSWKTVIPWNLAAGMYDPAIINGGTGTYSPERLMTFGNGYWIYVDSESTLKGCTA